MGQRCEVIRRAGCAALLLLVLPAGAAAQSVTGYPARSSGHINDYAEVLDEQHEQQLTAELRGLKAQQGVEVVVVTIKSVSDYPTGDVDVVAFGERLLASWGVGGATGKGVLIIVATKDNRWHIALGSAYGRLYRAVMDKVIADKMTPHLRHRRARRGIHEGVFGVIAVMTKKSTWLRYFQWHLILGVFAVACICAGFSCIRKGRSGWGWTYFTILLFIIVGLFKLLGRSRYGRWGGGSYGGW